MIITSLNQYLLLYICNFLHFDSILLLNNTNKNIYIITNNTNLWNKLYFYNFNYKNKIINKITFIKKYIFINQNILNVSNSDVIKLIKDNNWSNKLYYTDYTTINNKLDTFIKDNIYTIMADIQRIEILRQLKTYYYKNYTKNYIYYDTIIGINLLIDELYDRTSSNKKLIHNHMSHFIIIDSYTNNL
jgi:hypothetical protein